MGNSKGFAMKINNHQPALTHPSETLFIKKREYEENTFADLVAKSPTTTSPTQQSTGDEYYWQHQTHLQQSSLHFTPQPLTSCSQKPYTLKTNESAFNLSNLGENKHHQKREVLTKGLIQNTPTISINKQKLISQLTKLSLIIKKPSSFNALAATRFLKEHDIPSKQIKISDTLSPFPLFKKCHLFIQGEQAEITLNSQTLSSREQKELLYIIRNYLKKNGFVLHRLIINGVDHD